MTIYVIIAIALAILVLDNTVGLRGRHRRALKEAEKTAKRNALLRKAKLK